MDGPLAVQAEIAGSISRREECESSILLVSGKYLLIIYNVEWAIVKDRSEGSSDVSS